MTTAGGERDLVLALSGGVGGAKLVLGLSKVVPPGKLVVVANTGDDFEHFGLHVSPDVDTLLYTLAELGNPETGWGRRNETWTFMAALEVLGGETWFRLGDGDLATHVERTQRLKSGDRLSSIIADFARRFGIATKILPMTDDIVRTRVLTSGGWLDFQRYFVEQQCRPEVKDFSFEGATFARPHKDLIAALAEPTLRAVVICPSNPFISVDPILAVPGVRDALLHCNAPIVAVAPIIGGKAVKGPTAKMMRELGMDVSAAAVAHHYGSLLNGFVLDQADAVLAAELSVPTVSTSTLMRSLSDREQLAKVVLALADRLSEREGPSGSAVGQG
jgi:LPPG:FO 2-phospho-L-lactate transferase